MRTTQRVKPEKYALYSANVVFSAFRALFVANGSRLGFQRSFSRKPTDRKNFAGKCSEESSEGRVLLTSSTRSGERPPLSFALG